MRWILLFAAMIAVAAPASAQQIAPKNISGGGETALGGGLRLDGAIQGFGLPGNLAGRSESASHIVFSGIYPTFGYLISGRNLSDPAWLLYTRVEPAPPSRLAALPRPATQPAMRSHSSTTGWLQ